MKIWTFVIVALGAIVGFAWYEWQPWMSPKGQNTTQGSDQTLTVTSSVQSDAEFVTTTNPPLSPEARVSQSQPIRAKLSPVNYAVIGSEIDAKVSRLPFKDGQSFKVGELLIALDCDLQQAKLDRAQAELEIAERNSQANARLVLRGSVSKLDADNSSSERNKMLAQVRELSIRVAKCEIRAPYAGKVVELLVRQEQFVQVGQPLLEILDDSALEFEFIVPSRWLRWLTLGFPFEVVVEETNHHYPARIERIGARIDAISQTIRLVGAIDGRYEELMPGMSGVVNIEVPRTGAKDES